MKKILFFLVMTVFMLMQNSASGQLLVSRDTSFRASKVSYTSFHDFFPFSYVSEEYNGNLKTIFDDAMEFVASRKKITFDPRIPSENLTNDVDNIRIGEYDIFFGVYHATKAFDDIDFIYPSAFVNPVHIMMLPQNAGKIAVNGDLQNFKGVYIKQEYFSDYVLNKIKRMNAEGVDTPLQAYEKLFTGEADYVIGSYYYNYGQLCLLGLKNYVTFSKKSLWDMSVFVGLSTTSKHYAKLKAVFSEYVKYPEFSKLIEQNLRKAIKEAEIKSYSIVPPTFARQAQPGEETPADEQNTIQNDQEDKGGL